METINSISSVAVTNLAVKRVSSEHSQNIGNMEGGKSSVSDLSSVSIAELTQGKGDEQKLVASANRRDVERAVADMNDFFQTVQRSLQFTLDEESGTMVVQIKDDAGKVVKQIPTEEALELSRRLDQFRGLLFEGKV